jgi:hypothetical protein
MTRIKEFNSAAMGQFIENRSSNAPVSETGRTTSEQIFALRDCGSHYALMTGQGMNKDERPLGCHLCLGSEGRGSKQRASEYACIADRKIKQVFPEGRIIIEARLLPNHSGGFDFTIEWVDKEGKARTIDVEVDGEQHFRKAMHGTSVEAQRELDEDKDKLALRQGRRLLRLHYRDKRRWQGKLKYAKTLAERNKRYHWVLYSESYNRNDRMWKTEKK